MPDHLYKLLTEHFAIKSGPVQTINSHLETINGKWVDEWQDSETADTPDLKIDRLHLREILLKGIQEHVHFGKRLLNYEQQINGQITCHFDDGSSECGHVVIGADGVHSRVREIRFPHADPIESGDICIYGKTVLDGNVKEQISQKLQFATTVLFESELAVIIDAMRYPLFSDNEFSSSMFEMSPRQDYLYWAIIGKPGGFGLKKNSVIVNSSTELSAMIRHVTQTWDERLQALFKCANSSSMKMVPIRYSAVQTEWEATQVTLLGDAIHTMSPASGVGANSSLYDATILADIICDYSRQSGYITMAIAKYEQLMRAHSFAAMVNSRRGSTQLYGSESSESSHAEESYSSTDQ